MLVCLGYGYVAKHTSPLFEGVVVGTNRAGKPIDGARIFAYQGGAFKAELIDALLRATHVLISIAPTEEGDVVCGALSTLIPQMMQNLKWLGYLSSTSVYGDHQGEWVTEESETDPTFEMGIRRLQAEREWLDLLKQNPTCPLHVFRLSGIYGPGRNVVDQLRHGTARIYDSDDVLFSRIHVADIARLLKASMENPTPGVVYNLSDNHPSSSREVVEYGAELLKISPPSLMSLAGSSPQLQGFYRDFKKVDGRKIINELNITLQYPDYKSGLKSFL